MPTMHVTLKNGCFVKADKYAKLLKPTHLIGNGWECSIKKNGIITCLASRKYKDGVHSIKYLIHPNGFSQLFLQKPGRPMEILKKNFVTPKGMSISNGMIGLSGGPIDKRYAYFRDGAFQQLLKKFGFTGIKFVDPNSDYEIRSAYYDNQYASGSVITDGTSKAVSFDYGDSDYLKKTDSTWYECNTKFRVTNATWVLLTQYQDEDDFNNYFRILYTGINNLEELERSLLTNPLIAKRYSAEEQSKKLRDLDGTPINNMVDYHEVIQSIDQIAYDTYNKLDEPKVKEFLHQNTRVKFACMGPIDQYTFYFFLVSDNSEIEIAKGSLGFKSN